MRYVTAMASFPSTSRTTLGLCITARRGSSRSIEEDGLVGAGPGLTRAELESVVSIFDQMCWTGESGGGYPVLMPWSVGFDFNDERSRKVFLAESSFRAALYASADFAGGEAMRAVRHCFVDLNRYIEDEDVRERHVGDQQNEAELTGQPIVQREPRWIQEQLTAIVDMKGRCDDAAVRHQFGVVYGVRFQPSDVPNLKWHGAMGLISRCAIPASRLVGKVIIPADVEPAFCEDKQRLRVILEPSGVWLALRS